MSNQPPALDSNLNSGAPKPIDQLRREILSDIDEKLASVETYNFNELPIIRPSNQIGLHPIDQYFKEGKLGKVVLDFKYLAIGLLQQYREFIDKCSDYNTLMRFSNDGLASTSIDFTRWSTVAEAEEVTSQGIRTDIQRSVSLAESIVDLTISGINFQQLSQDLAATFGDPEKLAAIFKASVAGFPDGGPIPALKSMYDDFMDFMTSIDSQVTFDRAITVISEYLIAAKIVSDVATDALIRDIFSNIFNILANYFNGVIVGSYYKDE